MKEKIKLFAIVPPKKLYLDDFSMVQTLAPTEDGSWQRFCHPALIKEGFEKDGFKAKLVTVTIET